MMHNEYNLFESAIRITEKRDKKSLERALVETLSDFIDYDALILLRALPSASLEYLEVAVSSPNKIFLDRLDIIPYEYGDPRILPDNSIVSCISSQKPVSIDYQGEKRTLFPIIINNIVTCVFDIYGHKFTENSTKLIRGFIRIYSNFITIIDDNEHDTLTGLLNRKTFDAQLSEILSIDSSKNKLMLPKDNERRLTKNNVYHWVGMLDIDHFKSINDNYGHVYGDEVLLLFSNLMKKTFRNDDLLFRYGGEEFVVVLAPTTASHAFKVFERFRKALDSFDFPQVGRVTVSVGLVKIDVLEKKHTATMLEHADQALYYAKENGRNQTCDFHKLVISGAIKVRGTESNIELF